ncbi:hypothetical protein RDI58_025585 [Solanum bulbocastanum]|uniref:Uncharacterized protein n=1 Tax=Solanum bulbocastanum TaxID=147425 RepID=A0AAN8T4F7_SOLBU
MGVDAIAVKNDAAVLPEGSLDYAFDMVRTRDASKRASPKVQQDSLAFAFHMEVAGAVSTPNILKERKEVPYFARHTVVVSIVPLKGAIRGQRGAQLSVRSWWWEEMFIPRKWALPKECSWGHTLLRGPWWWQEACCARVYQECKGKN